MFVRLHVEHWTSYSDHRIRWSKNVVGDCLRPVMKHSLQGVLLNCGRLTGEQVQSVCTFWSGFPVDVAGKRSLADADTLSIAEAVRFGVLYGTVLILEFPVPCSTAQPGVVVKPIEAFFGAVSVQIEALAP